MTPSHHRPLHIATPALWLLVACNSASTESSQDAPAVSQAVSRAAKRDRTASDEPGLSPKQMAFGAEDKAEAERLVAGMTRTQLADFRSSVFDLPDKRRRALLYLAGPDAEARPARAALFELSNDSVYKWSDAERQHLLAGVLHWVDVEQTRADALRCAEDLAGKGLPKSLRQKMVELAGSQSPVPLRSVALRVLTSLQPLPEDAVQALRTAMTDDNTQVRFSGVGANGSFVDLATFWSRLAPDVVKRLQDPEPIVQAAAARMLVWSQPDGEPPPDAAKAALPEARKLVDHSNGALRCWSAELLGLYGEQKDIHLLAKHLDDTKTCQDTPKHRFVSPGGGAQGFMLGSNLGSVAYSASKAIWALTPAEQRPPELTQGDRFTGNRARSKKAIDVMKDWYGEHRPSI